MNTEPFELYYSVRDVSDRLQISQTVIRRDLKAGEFGPRSGGRLFFRGKDIRIPWSAIETYLKAHSSRSPAQLLAGEIRLAVLKASRGRTRSAAPGVPARSAGELVRKMGFVGLP